VSRVYPVLQGYLEISAKLVLRVHLDLLAQPEQPGQPVQQEPVDLLVHTGHLEHLVQLVTRVQLAHKVKRALPDCLEFKDLQDL